MAGGASTTLLRAAASFAAVRAASARRWRPAQKKQHNSVEVFLQRDAWLIVRAREGWGKVGQQDAREGWAKWASRKGGRRTARQGVLSQTP